MNLNLFSITSIVAMLLIASSSQAKSVDKLLEESLVKLGNMRGRFTSEMFDSEGEIYDIQKGQFWFALPGRYRIEYDYGDASGTYYVSDGNIVGLYDSELEESYAYKPEDLIFQHPYLSFLFDGQLSEDYFSFQVENPIDEEIHVILSPRNKVEVAATFLVIFRARLLSRINVNYVNASRAEFRFSNITTDHIEESIFDTSEFK